MAIVWLVEWDGISQEQFAELQVQTQWESDPPDGLQHQVSAFSDKSPWALASCIAVMTDGRSTVLS